MHKHSLIFTTTADNRAAKKFHNVAKPYGDEFYFILGQNFRLGVRTSGQYRYLRTGHLQDGQFVPNNHVLGLALGADIADGGVKLEKDTVNMMTLVCQLRKMTGYTALHFPGLAAK